MIADGSLRWSDRLLPPVLALVATVALFWLMSRMMDTGLDGHEAQPQIIANVEMVQLEPREDRPSPEQALADFDASPPPGPASIVPDPGGIPGLAALSMPAVPLDAGPVVIPTSEVKFSGVGLGASGNFGGFSSGAGFGGGGGGAGGSGTGRGFKGKELVPVSTARPQMPEWACKQGIRGWVEVVFTVTQNGHVQDVKLVDADPRGVFEAAAIESVSHWLYSPTETAHEVKQRVPMNPEDCAYNYR